MKRFERSVWFSLVVVGLTWPASSRAQERPVADDSAGAVVPSQEDLIEACYQAPGGVVIGGGLANVASSTTLDWIAIASR